MLNPYIVDILFSRIITGGINPATGQTMTIDDIKIPEYKAAVEERLNGGMF